MAEAKIAGMDDPVEIERTLREFMQGSSFTSLCEKAARQMATTLAVGQKTTWREAAAASTRGREIFLALKKELDAGIGAKVREITMANAWKIRTTTIQSAMKLTDIASQGYQAGLRPSEIAKQMKKALPSATNGQIKLIARTETSKAATALVEARSHDLGLNWYIWRTAKDGDRVRKSHQIMEGVICRWDDPPDPEALAGLKSYGPYHPGGFPNCRCIAIPIISIRDISYPAKVHIAGSVRIIRNAEEFERTCAA